TALHLAKHGHTVVATMLAKGGPLEAAAREQGLRLAVRELDVTDQVSIDREDAADAGARGARWTCSSTMPGSGAPAPQAHARGRTSGDVRGQLLGPIRIIQAVLPSMRERRAGYIVNATSIAGRIATPNQIPYSASKHALAAASKALAHEALAHEAL